MRDVPGWWQAALPEMHTTLEGFSAKLRNKLTEQPEKIIRRKNPFLYRVRHSETASASDLATSIVDAFLSSSEETMFGDVLESLSIIICRYAKGGRKSGIENIDLEFDQADGSRVLVQVKSGENWGNSSQRKALVEKFGRATRVLRGRAVSEPVASKVAAMAPVAMYTANIMKYWLAMPIGKESRSGQAPARRY